MKKIKRVPLSEIRLHKIAALYLIEIKTSQSSEIAKRISDFLAFIGQHKNDNFNILMKYHKCKSKVCEYEMSEGSPMYCPEHNEKNKIQK